eukprot:gene23384-biopygen16354
MAVVSKSTAFFDGVQPYEAALMFGIWKFWRQFWLPRQGGVLTTTSVGLRGRPPLPQSPPPPPLLGAVHGTRRWG